MSITGAFSSPVRGMCLMISFIYVTLASVENFLEI